MKGFKALLRLKGTYLGIGAAILFQVIFFSIWLTAYNGVFERSENLSIGIVNEDPAFKTEMIVQLEQKLPFNVKQYSTYNEAYEDMDFRKIEMFLQIPSDFTASLQAGERPSIHYWINQATATSSKTIMEQTANQITNEVGNSVFGLQQFAVLEAIEESVLQLPMEQPVKEQLGTAITSVISTLDSRPIEAVVNKTNAVEGFSASLVPLMVIISSFVGAMVMIMQINEAAGQIRHAYSKWSLFLGRQIINVAVSLLLPLLTISLMNIFDVSSQVSFMNIYLLQSILFLSFLLFAQVFVYLFGNVGMVFNILALSLQLVTSGVLVSRNLLGDGYQTISKFLPATYGADAYYTIVFGGDQQLLDNAMMPLLIIIGITLIVAISAVFFHRNPVIDKDNANEQLLQPVKQ